jgi:hypothetical protein
VVEFEDNTCENPGNTEEQEGGGGSREGHVRSLFAEAAKV